MFLHIVIDICWRVTPNSFDALFWLPALSTYSFSVEIIIITPHNQILTYKKIIEVTSEELFVGNGRGCFLPNTRVKMSDQLYSPIQNIQIGESVIDAYGKKQEVIDILSYDCNEEIIQLEFENGKIISCTKDHKFLTKNRGWVAAEHLEEVDDVVEV